MLLFFFMLALRAAVSKLLEFNLHISLSETFHEYMGGIACAGL